MNSYDDWYITEQTFEDTLNYYDIKVYIYPSVRLEID